MRQVIGVLGFVASALVVQPAFASTVSLQSILVNANGALYVDENLVPGVNTAGWSGVTGEGTLSFAFNPGPGAYFFDVFFDHQLNLPFFNEYGSVLGAPVAGQSWEIGDSFTSTIYPDVLLGGALPDTNTLAGTTSNFNNACVGAACNGDFAAAMGFSFILGAGEAAFLTFNVAETDPGAGLRLQGTHPVDPANPTALRLFISGSLRIGPPDQHPVPEPSSLYLLAVASVPLVWKLRRRHSRN